MNTRELNDIENAGATTCSELTALGLPFAPTF